MSLTFIPSTEQKQMRHEFWRQMLFFFICDWPWTRLRLALAASTGLLWLVAAKLLLTASNFMAVNQGHALCFEFRASKRRLARILKVDILHAHVIGHYCERNGCNALFVLSFGFSVTLGSMIDTVLYCTDQHTHFQPPKTHYFPPSSRPTHAWPFYSTLLVSVNCIAF